MRRTAPCWIERKLHILVGTYRPTIRTGWFPIKAGFNKNEAGGKYGTFSVVIRGWRGWYISRHPKPTWGYDHVVITRNTPTV